MSDPAPTVLPIEDFATSALHAEHHHLDVIASLLERIRELKQENAGLKLRNELWEKTSKKDATEKPESKSQHLRGGAMDVKFPIEPMGEAIQRGG